MTLGYIVFGGVLVAVGAAVTWLRFSPLAKRQQEAERELAMRRAEAAKEVAADEPVQQDHAAAQSRGAKNPVTTDRGAKLWNTRTALLGPLGIAVGMVLIVLGVVGG